MATTTNYSWTTPDNTAYVKDGASAIRSLGSSVDSTLFTALGGAYPGLRLVKKQTVGTGVSSVNVTSAFSSTYENYKIIYTNGALSAGAAISLRLGATATGYNYNFIYSTYAGSGVQVLAATNATSFVYAGGGDANGHSVDIDVYAPFIAKNTYISTISKDNGLSGSFGGVIKNTTSYTDFTILVSGVTLTGGTIYVYGYGAS